jgi:hypothetical protein
MIILIYFNLLLRILDEKLSHVVYVKRGISDISKDDISKGLDSKIDEKGTMTEIKEEATEHQQSSSYS